MRTSKFKLKLFFCVSMCYFQSHLNKLRYESMSLSSSQNEQTHYTNGNHCGWILLLFHWFEPKVSLNSKESVFTLFLFSGTLAPNSRDHCQMGKRLHRKKERPESIRKWQLFICARGAGQLPGLVGWLEAQPAGAAGSTRVWWGGGRRWRLGCWMCVDSLWWSSSLNISNDYFKQLSFDHHNGFCYILFTNTEIDYNI